MPSPPAPLPCAGAGSLNPAGCGGVPCHCETGAAGRSNPLRPAAQRVIAPPAQPVEAIPSPPAPLPCAGAGSLNPAGCAGVPCHCATGAAGRSNPLTPCPAPVCESRETGAARASIPRRVCRGALSLRHRRSRSKQSPHPLPRSRVREPGDRRCARVHPSPGVPGPCLGDGQRSNIPSPSAPLPCAEPGDRRSRSKQSPHPLPRSRVREPGDRRSRSKQSPHPLPRSRVREPGDRRCARGL
ncbi:MAG: hypothetical protein KatS3mg058_1261 [Roseiflexus sp.]|nr:MAG: hypothetical protein KatS3mg058_1261 [Roseiflexus sp.]